MTVAIESGQAEAVTYVVLPYARFLAFKCSDANRAVEIMNLAISKSQGWASKTLFLSYVNLLKHLEGAATDTQGKIVQVFEKGIEETGLTIDDRAELARFYLEYLHESCPSIVTLRSTVSTLRSKGLLGS